MRRRQHGWQGVELISPILNADGDGFYEVLQVVEFLRNNFWIDTPEKAGFHIHVGNGKASFERYSLRRIASLLYLADPVLAQSHPKHRRWGNMWAPSNRAFSRVSFGMKARHTQYRPPDPNETDDTPPRQPWWSRWSNPPGTYGERRDWAVERAARADEFPPRPNSPVYPSEVRQLSAAVQFSMLRDRDEYGITHDPADLRPRVSMQDAVDELIASPTRDILAQLLSVTTLPPGMYRPAYNFDGYFNLGDRAKRTIEFRQQAATIDAAAVICYTCIALRLCEFAAIADFGLLMKIGADLAIAEDNAYYYDVYDFLLDIDLRPEADFLSRIARGADKDVTGREYLVEIGVTNPPPVT
ncbi:hypothetical protein GGR53DRAFT_479898 [Hypoxylon sp. FL1150]|nr:hypothetical protein GGR53DRAFT_479898 [Hypoxylon sp. FL1150]